MTSYYIPNNGFTAKDGSFYTAQSWLAILHVAMFLKSIIYAITCIKITIKIVAMQIEFLHRNASVEVI